MEQALERAKTIKSMKSSHGSSSKMPIEEQTEESSEEEEDQQNKEQIDTLRSQIADIQLRRNSFFKQSCDWRDKFAQNMNQQMAQLGEKMDNYHSKSIRHIYRYPRPPPPPPD